MALAAKTMLGPYRIQSALGAGGQGEVYEAWDTRLSRTVAVKVIPAHLPSSPQLKERFDREARALAALEHPNIVKIHDVCHYEGVDLLVMEYLEGETVAARLEKGPLPLEQALRIAIEISSALGPSNWKVRKQTPGRTSSPSARLCMRWSRGEKHFRERATRA